MLLASRNLKVGDFALTDFNGDGKLTRVQIIARDDKREHGNSGSGVMYRVEPPLKHGSGLTWYDSAWFVPDIVAPIQSQLDVAVGALEEVKVKTDDGYIGYLAHKTLATIKQLGGDA